MSAGAIVLAIAACKLAVHLYAGRHYGYFVDELYYLACSRHLDWGYVDQPPLIALVTWVVRMILGQSLAALRLLPALAGVAEVLLTALIARELGGQAIRPSAGSHGSARCAGYPGCGRHSYDERLRAAVLDGLRVPADPPDQNRKHKAVDLVWCFGGIRAGKQVLHADLRRWPGAGAAC